jgi:diadenosine tetraphosphate (Ap4A) HIT family hydrolase
MGTGVLSRGKAAGGVNLNTHLHVVPRVRMSGAILLHQVGNKNKFCEIKFRIAVAKAAFSNIDL